MPLDAFSQCTHKAKESPLPINIHCSCVVKTACGDSIVSERDFLLCSCISLAECTTNNQQQVYIYIYIYNIYIITLLSVKVQMPMIMHCTLHNTRI